MIAVAYDGGFFSDVSGVSRLSGSISGGSLAIRRPRDSRLLTAERQNVPYVWVHPDEER